MSFDRPEKTWKVEDIDRLLAFLPIFEDPEFVPFEVLEELSGEKVNGILVINLGVVRMHSSFNEALDTIGQTSAWTDPYVHTRTGKVDDELDDSDFEQMDLPTLRRWFSFVTRGERFCTGFDRSLMSSGSFVAALRRLKQLREAM